MKGVFAVAIVPVVLAMGCAVLSEPLSKAVVQETPSPIPPTVDELVREIAPKYGVPVKLLRALVQQESRGNPTARRKEPSQVKYAKRYSRDPKLIEEFASSHGLGQIMGWVGWSEYRVLPHELRNPRVNLEVTSALLRKRFDQARKIKTLKEDGERWAWAVDKFNGATTEHARRVFARMIELS